MWAQGVPVVAADSAGPQDRGVVCLAQDGDDAVDLGRAKPRHHLVEQKQELLSFPRATAGHGGH